MTSALKYLSIFLAVSGTQAFSAPSHTYRQHSLQRSANPRVTNIRQQDTRLEAFAVDGALSTMDTFFQTQPYLSAFLTCSLKASAADWVAQSQQPEDERNVNRNLAFIAYGGLYQGCVQTFIFGVLFPALFPDHTFQSILTQVAIDILILGPMVCMPTVYTMKALFAGEEPTSGLAKYVDHVQHKGILFKYWSIWAPVQTLNFGIVPAHLRVVFVAMVSFFWICLLSTVSSSSDDETEPENPVFAATDKAYPSLPQTVPIPVLSEAFEAAQRETLGRAVVADQWARSTSS